MNRTFWYKSQLNGKIVYENVLLLKTPQTFSDYFKIHQYNKVDKYRYEAFLSTKIMPKYAFRRFSITFLLIGKSIPNKSLKHHQFWYFPNFSYIMFWIFIFSTTYSCGHLIIIMLEPRFYQFYPLNNNK